MQRRARAHRHAFGAIALGERRLAIGVNDEARPSTSAVVLGARRIENAQGGVQDRAGQAANPHEGIADDADLDLPLHRGRGIEQVAAAAASLPRTGMERTIGCCALRRRSQDIDNGSVPCAASPRDEMHERPFAGQRTCAKQDAVGVAGEPPASGNHAFDLDLAAEGPKRPNWQVWSSCVGGRPKREGPKRGARGGFRGLNGPLPPSRVPSRGQGGDPAHRRMVRPRVALPP